MGFSGKWNTEASVVMHLTVASGVTPNLIPMLYPVRSLHSLGSKTALVCTKISLYKLYTKKFRKVSGTQRNKN